MGRERIIGKYKGKESGPLLIITAAMHGNEAAGVYALEQLFDMLDKEPIINPEFVYKGEIIGIIGNLKAFEHKQRYVKKDINRCWTPENITQLRQSDKSNLECEDLEILDILDVVQQAINESQPQNIFLLDLHTTSSDGIFCIATNDPKSIHLAKQIHAPLILGLLHGIKGTTLHYFTKENIGIDTTSIAFEGGHHDDPTSIDRCIAATINFMRAIEVIKAKDVESKHDRILLDFSACLPQVVEAFYKYPISSNKAWEMKPGFKNFDYINKGDFLAKYDGQPVFAQFDGHILMPLYQKQGSDGYFIAKKIE